MSKSENIEVRVVTSKELHENAGTIFTELLRDGGFCVISRYGEPTFQLTTITEEVREILDNGGNPGPGGGKASGARPVEIPGNGNKS